MRTNLDLDTLLIRADDRSVQRLVSVWLRDGHVVFEASGDGFPKVMNKTQCLVALVLLVHDDSKGQHIVDLVEFDLLLLHLSVDAPEILRSTVHLTGDGVLAHQLLQDIDHLTDEALALPLLL